MAIFPEAGLCPNEQAAFLLSNKHMLTEVITFSPYIISDAEPDQVHFIDDTSERSFKAESVGIMLRRVWRQKPFGEIADRDMRKMLMSVYDASSSADVAHLIQDVADIGDSEYKAHLLKELLTIRKT